MTEKRFLNTKAAVEMNYGDTITEDLNRYLAKKHGCWFAKFTAGYALQSTRNPDKGKMLARNLSFDDMMAIALARPTE